MLFAARQDQNADMNKLLADAGASEDDVRRTVSTIHEATRRVQRAIALHMLVPAGLSAALVALFVACNAGVLPGI